MMRRLRVFEGTIGWGLIALLGCDTEASQPGFAGLEVRDSAGVLIVENSADLVAEAPDLRLEEELRIGAIDGSPQEEFFFLMDLAVNEDGEIYALDSGSRTVRVFSPDGAHALEFGGRGQGPGEFSSEMLRIAVAGDSLIIQDRARFHVFTIQGEYLGGTLQQVTGNAIPNVLSRGPHGWLLGQIEFSRPPSIQQRTTRDTFRIAVIDVSAGTVDRALVAEPSRWRRYLPNMGQSRGQWLGPEVAAAVRANGEIYLVRGDEYEIDVLSPEGQLVRKIRAGVERTPVDARDLEDWIQSSRYSFGDDEVRELGPPDLKPIAGRLLVAPSGRLLMNRRDLSSLRNADPETFFETWDLVGANGRVEGRFNVDASTYLRVLTDSMVYAIVRDALDVQYIVGYRIVPTGD